MADIRTIVREPLTGPGVWRGPDLTPADYLYELNDEELTELGRLRAELVARGVGLGAVDPESTPVPALADTIAEWLDRLENRIGFVVIRGLELDGWSYWTMGEPIPETEVINREDLNPAGRVPAT